MRITRFSIRKLLLSTALFLAILLLFIGTITNYFLRQSFSQFEIISEIERINTMGLQARSLEKDFMIKETVNNIFFQTGKSRYIERFDSLSHQIDKSLKRISSLDMIASLELTEVLESTIQWHRQYSTDFRTTTQLVRARGLKDHGLIGEFRRSIHNVESQFNEMENYYYSTQMLTLRRHEKDYLLRKDLSYQEKFHSVLKKLILDLEGKRNQKKSTEIIALLNNYGDLFDKLIEIDKKIGISDNDGMLGKLNAGGNSFESGLTQIHDKLYNYSRNEIKSSVGMLFAMVGVISIAAVLLLLFVARHIVTAIKRLQRYISRLGSGELPDLIEVQSNDEIAQMEKSINTLTDNLRNTRSFAIEVGNGNLDSEVNVFGNKGDLGGALIEMRKKLLQVSNEREQQTIETERRMWANEGMAIFAEILRMRDKTMEDLAFEIIKTLVKYTKSNQAGIFLMNREEGEKPVLNLLATYAWERKKYSKMQIELNEGLVGTCALEAETTLFTDIPKDYIRITSGLGETTPTCLILVPLKVEGEVLGVIEMASFNIYQPYEIEFIEKVIANVASTLQMVRINTHTKQLLERTQQQAEELQAQEEEMRQNMEEMQSTQEWMSQREEELKNEIAGKDEKINRIIEKSKKEIPQTHEKYIAIETVHVVFNSYFLIAELTKKGDVFNCNLRFKKVLSSVDDIEISNIFENSLPNDQEANRTEWQRIVNGETYRGVIHRIDSQGNHVAIQSVFSPVVNAKGDLEKVLFVGQKIGLVDEKISEKANGNWVKEFIPASNFLCESETLMS
ncbi:MAG: HAMP domain-containing protein [Perlabentimonas sp.]